MNDLGFGHFTRSDLHAQQRSQTRLWLHFVKDVCYIITFSFFLLVFSPSENGSLLTLQTWREIFRKFFPRKKKVTQSRGRFHSQRSAAPASKHLPLQVVSTSGCGLGYETAVGGGGSLRYFSAHSTMNVPRYSSSHTFIFFIIFSNVGYKKKRTKSESNFLVVKSLI